METDFITDSPLCSRLTQHFRVVLETRKEKSSNKATLVLHYFKLLVTITSPFHDIIEIQFCFITKQKKTDQAEHEKTKRETIEMMSKQKTILIVGYIGEFLYNFI
jgi:hypothetical protein